MEIRQVQYFLSIARTGSFTAAADELFVSQSSLSKRIIALEQELGVALFDRSRRRVSLTEAGKAFHEHAIKLHEAYKAMMADLQEVRPEMEPLSIAAIPVIAQYGIPKYIAVFRETHPGIRVTLEEREAAEIIPALNDRRYDLAFVRDNCVDRERHACLEICQDRMIVVVCSRHHLASKSVVSLQELTDENFIVLEKATAIHQLVLDACRGAGFEPRVVHSTLRNDSIIAQVAANMGIALMMERLYDYHKQPEVVALELEQVIDSRIVLAYLKDRKLSGSAQAFIESIAGLLPSPPGEGR
jgi:DNA-binding transcriptional LysR family regulator